MTPSAPLPLLAEARLGRGISPIESCFPWFRLSTLTGGAERDLSRGLVVAKVDSEEADGRTVTAVSLEVETGAAATGGCVCPTPVASHVAVDARGTADAADTDAACSEESNAKGTDTGAG